MPLALTAWLGALGVPTGPAPLATPTVVTTDDPLLVYWMAVYAAPLGVGPTLPGTLVANFDKPDRLRDYTFLAAASEAERAALVAALHGTGWVRAEGAEQRTGGVFHELLLALPDGGEGRVSVREGEASPMPDGRPGVTVWMHVTAP